MDRRKIQSNNALHKRLYSASQLAVKSVSDSVKNNIVRSASADDNRSSRKRKNSDVEDTNSSKESSPKVKNIIKKRRKKRYKSEDEDEKEILPKQLKVANVKNKKKQNEKLLKQSESEESNSGRKSSSNGSDDDEENEENNLTGRSSIRGMLEALDKSPSKLSQNSNISFNKYRRLDLRRPTQSKLQQSVSKNKIDRHREISKQELSDEPLDEIEIEKFDLKNNLIETLSKKENNLDESVKSDYSLLHYKDQVPVDTNDTSVKKNTIKCGNKNPLGVPHIISKNKRHHEVQASPVKNYRNRKKKSLECSSEKNSENNENDISNVNIEKKTYNETDDILIHFLSAAGITLYPGEVLHVANNNSREIIEKMKKLLSLNSFDVDEIIESWNNYINDEESLKKSLLEIKIETDEGQEICSKALSLSRILLQIPKLQVEIFQSLFKKLIDTVITSESSDEAPWAIQILQQFRFLENIVDSDFLIVQIEQLLSKSPEWFQCEVIVFIPDIVTDAQHHETAEMLVKIMRNNSNITNNILDCIQNLILSKDYKEELRAQILKLLENNVDKNSLPAITRFILDTCATEEIALKSLSTLRLINITASSKKEINETYTNQIFIINAIKMNIQLFKEVSQAAFTFIKTSNSEAVALDIIVLILLYETITVKKKIIETIFFNHIKNGYYKINLLNTFYTGYKEVAKSLEPTALNLAIILLKANNYVHVEFGVEWIRNIFISQCDTSYKQRKILERLLNLMGNKDQTVKNALEVLSRMVNNEAECQCFEHHAAFLRFFVEKIDNLEFDEVASLYHILHGLCTQSELISNILNDDLTIIMQKQLNSSKVLTKCKGVLGAVMAIKHFAKNSETSDQAFELINKTLNLLKNCTKSQTLFFDQLGKVFNNNYIDKKFLSEVINFFEDKFVSSCLVESNTNNDLVPKFGLNDSTIAENYYVNFGNGKSGTLVSAFFKLLCICNLRYSGSLESVNAVLGCSILLPNNFDLPEPLTADYMIHCINWFREIIGGFVTQEEHLLREQVLKRLQSVMTLQGEFVMILSMCGSLYEPPPCYFHYFPIPKFIRMDTKFGKKGTKKVKKKNKKENMEKKSENSIDTILNKSVLLSEWNNWRAGSEMTIKNPAFFRQMDTRIINLLDLDTNINSSQTFEKITIAQVCFIIKELLGMFENQTSEQLIEDLIKLLPKICVKFKKIISDLRQYENVQEQEAVRLILCLLTTIFNWKEFVNAKHNILLRDGLRTLASMTKESNITLKSCKDLVAEAYTYFESLSDIANQISIAVGLVNMCNCLMNHSTSFMEQSKERQAKMAFGFLSLDWRNNGGSEYKVAIRDLLQMWMNNESDPLETVSSIMQWLPEEVKSFNGPKSRLNRLASINKINFPLLIKQLFIGLVKGVQLSLNLAEKDPQRIKIWLDVGIGLEKLSEICKMNRNNVYLILFIRYTAILYQILLTSGMKMLELNIKYQTEEVLNVIKLFQKSGRVLRDIFCTARKDNNVSLLKLIPLVKSRREKFIFRVKGMLTANNSIGAFWMGNLLNKDLDGEEIVTESSEDLATASELTSENNINNTEEMESEIFNSDTDEDSDNIE